MTPLEMARNECANYDQGKCLGVAIDNSTCHPLPQCLLHDNGSRCAYFERFVLPMADRGRPDFIQARNAYRGGRAMKAPPDDAFKCACGAMRAPRKRMCADCARQHRRNTTRNGMRKKRSGCEQLSPKTGL